jgi:hypothetical protein
MKSNVALICMVMGCAGASVFRDPNAGEQVAEAKPPAEPLFTRTDQTFIATPRAAPATVLLEDKELAAAPPFRAVGIVEMEGKETTQLSAFYDAAAKAGASFGCDVLYQRDAFELGTRIAKMRIPNADPPNGPSMGHFIASSGREWTRNNMVRWQFLCGVNGGTYAEQDKSMKAATNKAVEARRTALGNYEPCDAYTPTGSHVRRNDVCANSVKRNDADLKTPAPGQ